jgi:ABC-type thiamine transport system ATPase subunit
VQIEPINPKLKLPRTKRSKLKYDEPLSNFAFKFNMRCYTMVVGSTGGGKSVIINTLAGWSLTIPTPPTFDLLLLLLLRSSV